MLGRGGGMMGRPATEGRGRICTGELSHLLKHASMLLVDSQVHLQPALSQAEGQLSCRGRRGFGQAWQGRAGKWCQLMPWAGRRYPAGFGWALAGRVARMNRAGE